MCTMCLSNWLAALSGSTPTSLCTMEKGKLGFSFLVAGAGVLANLLTIDRDLAVVVHGIDLDNVLADERAADGDLLSGGQAVGVLRALVAALDGDLRALDNPKLAVTVEARAGAIKSHQVGVAPEHAHLRGRRHRGRRLQLRRRDADRSHSCRGNEKRLHGRRRGAGGHDNGDGNQDEHREASGKSVEGLAPLRDEQDVALACSDVLVGGLGGPVATAATDERHHASACRALLADHAPGPTHAATAGAAAIAVARDVHAGWHCANATADGGDDGVGAAGASATTACAHGAASEPDGRTTARDRDASPADAHAAAADDAATQHAAAAADTHAATATGETATATAKCDAANTVGTSGVVHHG
mmetsp:Transcript_53652/g.174507  ORF Transcript_53652/g.174507 Transcript_53652/m.174507 type:complete len:360 (-) Transcript_53652:129-1208(-)